MTRKRLIVAGSALGLLALIAVVLSRESASSGSPPGGKPSGSFEVGTEAVVHFPFFGVVQYIVGLLHFFELLLSRFVVGMQVGMESLREAPMRPRYLQR